MKIINHSIIASYVVLFFVTSSLIAKELSTENITTGSLTYNNSESLLHVATLEVKIPDAPNFILRGNIPIPQNVFNFRKGVSLFGVLDPVTQEVIPAQTEQVAYYPSGKPSVIELIVKINTPSALEAGSYVKYKIFNIKSRVPTAPKRDNNVSRILVSNAISTPPQIVNILNKGIKIRTYDVFGHKYTVDLLKPRNRSAMQIKKFGKHAIQIRTYDTLQPEIGVPLGAPNGALNHMMGIHAYLTVWNDEPVISLDLRISNASNGLDPLNPADDAMRDLYFKKVELLIGKHSFLTPSLMDPTFGDSYIEGNYRVYPIIKKEPNGKMHNMHSVGNASNFGISVKTNGAHTNRYYTISKREDLEIAKRIVGEEGLGFAKEGISSTNSERELFSWQNKATGNYFPQRQRLPNMDYYGISACRQEEQEGYQHYKYLLESGVTAYPVNEGRLGWATPIYVKEGGEPGGGEIDMFEGIKAAGCRSLSSYKKLKIISGMYADRHANFLYNSDGTAIEHDDFIQSNASGGYQPIVMFNSLFFLNNPEHDPFHFKNAPLFQAQYVANQNLQSSYESILTKYAPIDYEHHTRISKYLIALTWLGNDSLAKDDLQMLGNLYRLSLTEYQWDANNQNGHALSMLTKLNAQNAFGTFGHVWHRGEYWGVATVAAAYATSALRERRAALLPWIKKTVDLLDSNKQDCTGFREHGVGPGYPEWRMERGDIRGGSGINSIQSVLKSVFEDVHIAREEQLKTIIAELGYAMIGPGWRDDWPTIIGPVSAPYFAVPIGIAGDMNSEFCSIEEAPQEAQEMALVKGPDFWHSPSSFAYFYEATQDSEFLDKAFDYFGGYGGSLQGETLLERIIHPNTQNYGHWNQNLNNFVATLALAQELEGPLQ